MKLHVSKGKIMDNRTYLKTQATELLRVARSCFDLEAVRKLRHIAQDMERRASDEGDIPPGYMHHENGHSGDMDHG